MHTRTCIGTHSPSLQICNVVRIVYRQIFVVCLFVSVTFQTWIAKEKVLSGLLAVVVLQHTNWWIFCLMVCLFVCFFCFVLQLGNFFSLTEKEVPGYEAPSLITELHIHLEDLVMDYRCVWFQISPPQLPFPLTSTQFIFLPSVSS